MFKSFNFSLMLRGIILAIGIAMIASLIYSLLLTFSPLTESTFSFNLILSLSVFLGALFSAHRSGTKGLYYGLAIGTGVLLFLVLLSGILLPVTPSWVTLGEKAMVCWISGGIGGILGILIRR